jgi:hypothetical protein
VQPIVRAERFELVDRNGQVRAVLGQQQGAEEIDGIVGLVLFGVDGVPRFVAGLSPADRPGLALSDRPGPARILMALYPEGSAAMR